MHLAASGGHYELMQFLFSKGGSVEDEDKVRNLIIPSPIFCVVCILCRDKKLTR